MKSITGRTAIRRLVLITTTLAALLLGSSMAASADEGSGSQNNYAIAVNQRNNSSLIRTSMRIVYVTGNVTAFNAADAEATCTHCQTAAVAIEAIIVIGSPQTYAPQNLAVALNTNCHFCDTGAYAGQFDLQYAGPVRLTENGREQIEALRDQLRDLRNSGLTSAQIVQRGSAIRWQLESVLKSNLVPAEGERDQPIQHDRAEVRAA